jgi:hypothetical protein
LYQQERSRLGEELSSGRSINPTLKTSIDSIDHSPTALYQRLETLYPFRLRQLILISVITSLEVYLTDVIIEIFERDITPFKKDEPVKFQKNYLLSLSSMEKIHNDLIVKDFRSLTSGGLNQIVKYYKKMFEIDLKNLGIDFNIVEEIHIRRHLFVHRNGSTDPEYVNKYPALGYKIAEQIKIEHQYLIDSLQIISDFSGKVNKAILRKFPDKTRQIKYHIGVKDFDKQLKSLMIEISLLKTTFDHINYLNNLVIRGLKLSDYIVQLSTVDNTCLLFINGKQSELSKFYKPIHEHEFLNIVKTVELKK